MAKWHPAAPKIGGTSPQDQRVVAGGRRPKLDSSRARTRAAENLYQRRCEKVIAQVMADYDGVSDAITFMSEAAYQAMIHAELPESLKGEDSVKIKEKIIAAALLAAGVAVIGSMISSAQVTQAVASASALVAQGGAVAVSAMAGGRVGGFKGALAGASLAVASQRVSLAAAQTFSARQKSQKTSPTPSPELPPLKPANLDKYGRVGIISIDGQNNLIQFAKAPEAELVRFYLNVKNHNVMNSNYLHNTVMNHLYSEAEKILELVPSHRDTVLNDSDFNGRSSLMLALFTDAPEGFCRELMTRENVVKADKFGITPLMLAAMSGSPDLVRDIISRVPEEERADYIKMRDYKGRVCLDYLEFNKEQIRNIFSQFKVDPEKDVNSSNNCMFGEMGNIFRIKIANHQGDLDCTQENHLSMVSEKFSRMGLSTSPCYSQRETFTSLLASQDNQNALREMRLDQIAREKLEVFLAEFYENSKEVVAQAISASEYQRGFAGVSLSSRCMNQERRKNVREIIDREKEKPKNSSVTSPQGESLSSSSHHHDL